MLVSFAVKGNSDENFLLHFAVVERKQAHEFFFHHIYPIAAFALGVIEMRCVCTVIIYAKGSKRDYAS